MGACIRKRVVYYMSCKRFQFFVNVEALIKSGKISAKIPEIGKIKAIFGLGMTPI